jgi:6-phosphogluconolactonase (cycloisomerase 2 family)
MSIYRAKSLVFCLLAALLCALAGCVGAGGSGSSPSGAVVMAQRPVSGTVHLLSNAARLAEQKSLQISEVEIVGRDSHGRIRFGPRIVNALPDIMLGQVSSDVVTLQLHYRSAGRNVAVGSVAVNLSAETSQTLEVPELQNIDTALVSLSIIPAEVTLPAGFSRPLTVTAMLADESVVDVSDLVSWSCDQPAVATVDRAVLTARQTGSCRITAALNHHQASVGVVANHAALTSIMLQSSSHSALPVGLTENFEATGVFDDGTTLDVTGMAVWTSSDPSVASAAENGIVTGLGAGLATVSAQVGDTSGSLAVTVGALQVTSLQVDAPVRSLVRGVPTQAHATAVFTDGSVRDVSEQAAWTSDGAATVSGDGTMALATAGSVTVTATFGGQTARTVKQASSAHLASIQVTPATASIPLHFSQPYTATGIFSDGTRQDLTAVSNWSVSNSAVASISNANPVRGIATGLKAGTVTVTASHAGVNGRATLTVSSLSLKSIQLTPATPTVPVGLTQQFSATGIMSDNSKMSLTALVSWSSSNAKVATINSSGVATAIAIGSATMQASYLGVSGTTTLTVSAPQLVSLQVTPPLVSVPVGETQGFNAQGIYTDHSTHDVTTSVTWTSSATNVVTVSNVAGSQGVATVRATGSATITASLAGQQATATLTGTAAVLTAVQVSPPVASVALGFVKPFTATALYSDGSRLDVTKQATWTSSDAGVATVSNGNASTASVGTTTIQATYGGQSATASLSVTPAILVAIQVTPINASVAAGLSQQFTATAIYSDQTRLDVTSMATWASSNPSVVVSNAPANSGLVGTTGVGTATISATLNGITGSTMLTVTAAQRTGLQIKPGSANVAAGLTQQFTALASYTDGSQIDVSSAVTWQVDNSSVAAISNVNGSNGLATGLAVGSAAVTASDGTFNAQATLAVSAAQVVSIAVSPSTASVAAGYGQQFKAIATLTDKTQTDITASAAWTSSDDTVAAVSNVAPTVGLATSLQVGNITITAAYGGASGSASLGVTAAVLTGITVSPPIASVASGLTQQFSATASYSDNRTQDVTSAVTWMSDTPAVMVSNASPTCGLASTMSPCTADVTASLGGFSGQATLTVKPSSVVFVQGPPTQVTTHNSFTVSVQLEDASGAVIQNSNIPVSLALGNNNSYLTLAGGSPTSVVNGVATFSLTVDRPQNDLTLVAAASGFASASSQSFKACNAVGRFAYAADFGTNEISAFSIDASSGSLLPINFNGGTNQIYTSARDVLVSHDGGFLYASSYYNNAIRILSLAGNGAPAPDTGVSPNTPGHNDGTGPYFMALDWSGTHLYCPNRDSNTISSFSVNPDGTLSILGANDVPAGNTPLEVVVHPSGQFVYAVNQISGDVSGYSVNADGTLAPLGNSPYALNPGSQPWGVAMDPAGSFLYVSDTAKNAIVVMAIDKTSGDLREVPGSPFTVVSGTAYWVSVTPDGNAVYADDSDGTISAFRVNRSTGVLTPIAGSTFGAALVHPEHMSVDPSGQFLYVPDGIGGNSIRGFAIDAATYRLTEMSASPFAAGNTPGFGDDLLEATHPSSA